MAEASGKNNPRAQRAAGSEGASKKPRHSQPVGQASNPRHSQPVDSEAHPSQPVGRGEHNTQPARSSNSPRKSQPVGSNNPRAAQSGGSNNPRHSQPIGSSNPRKSQPVGSNSPRASQPLGSNNPRRSQPLGSNNPRASQPLNSQPLGDSASFKPVVPLVDGSNPYSRGAAVDEYARNRRRKKRRRILLGVFIFLLVGILGATGAAWAYISNIETNMQENITPEVVEALEPPVEYDGGTFYMLLIGSDHSAYRESIPEYGDDSYRSDSMMLARVDPENKKVTLVSIERDIQMEFEGYGKQKLNAAYSIGGPAMTIKTVSELAGVPISHYAEIDFDGFENAVDVLGGIEVDVPIDIDDEEAGGQLSAGPQTLDGEQALVLCRSRHSYDEYGAGDYYRAANQRMVIAALAQKILASDVSTIASTVESLSKYVTTDLSVMDIISLANAMRGLDTDEDVYTAMTPASGVYENDTWYEILDEAAWNTMMGRVRQGLPPTEEDVVDEFTGIVMAKSGEGAPASSDAVSGVDEPKKTFSETRTGVVTIKNGNGVNGVGAQALERIAPLGYSADASNARSFNYAETVVVFDTADQRKYAEELIDALGCGRAVQNNGEYDYEGDFLILIGADWQ